ncbi:MAG: hypothetical protein V3S71_07280, partial [Acidobacteriota bacterium]
SLNPWGICGSESAARGLSEPDDFLARHTEDDVVADISEEEPAFTNGHSHSGYFCALARQPLRGDFQPTPERNA